MFNKKLATNKKKFNEHFYSLDFFRGFCGYGVAITHFCAFVFNDFYMEYLSFLFVELFFVLSGFVLYPQLIKVLNDNKKLFIFYKRRWLRTLPLYFVSLVLVSILTNQLFSNDFYKYFLLIQKTIPQFIVNDYYPVAWSLSVEEIFYLCFPIFLIFLNKSNFMKVSIYTFILISIAKFFFAGSIESNFYRTGSFLRLDAILLGFILAHYKTFFLDLKKIILFLNISILVFYFLNYDLFINNKNSAFIKFSFILIMQSISVLMLLSFINFEKYFKANMFRKFCILISQQTYSIYLTHIIFIYILKKIDFTFSFSLSLYVFLLFISSFLVYNFFEKPILLKRPRI